MMHPCCQACAEGRPEHVITDAAGRPWRFEVHHFCGPIVLRQDGQPKERQPGSRSPFWPAFDAWNNREESLMADHDTLAQRLQQQCVDWGTYWRASDAHGVELTPEQALELLRTALGVEVEIKPPASRNCKLIECLGKTRCRSCLVMDAAYPAPAKRPTWVEILLLVNEYTGHVADASQHQAASREDISKTAAMATLGRLRALLGYGVR